MLDSERMYREMALPIAGTLHCHRCETWLQAPPEAVATYLATGWPVCCGHSMTLTPLKPEGT